ncbi:hypothetical protein BP5796_03282 [Coleophoma crateriformis]|uniref:Anaphase-promoting complex subunit 4-like WD40 domain-containing protein n=1 Tax=Coleophoma crateriformis TaxID=565419 RepID=A0A3D8SP68_9HELO|nr:hypothetical protein BP5796_03282 [Coleophoma crateriformis]
MNLALSDPFVLAQDYPEQTTGSLRSGHATSVRFNRKGDCLAVGRVDGTVVIFDVETQGIARKLKGHTRQVQSLCWSRFHAPVYIAELHPWDHFKFVLSLFEDQPLLVDCTNPEPIKMKLPTVPKRTQIDDEPIDKKQAAQDAKQSTTVSIFTASGDHILAGTSKGWLNIIEVATRKTIYSTKICTGVVIYLRLTNSGRDLVVNAQDRIIRTIQLPNLSAKDLDPDTIDIEVEHRFQDVVNRLSWNHVAFSSTGEYVTASTYNNHDIYIWERNHGSLVKILEGPKEEHGIVEWHPHRPMIAACGLESGRIHIWSITSPQRWSALAPDFAEVEENVEFLEHEDEYDNHPEEELLKQRLDLEDEDVDVLTIEPVKGEIIDSENTFKMPFQLDLDDSDSEEEFISIRRGEMRRKSFTGTDHLLDGDTGTSGDDRTLKKMKGRSKKR